MDEKTTEEFKKAFFIISKGFTEISQSQLEDLLFTLGCKPLLSPPYINEIQTAFDPTTNKISYESLMKKLNEMMTIKSSEAELKEALAVFDESGKGKVSKSELRRALIAYSKLPKEQIDLLLNANQPGEYIDLNEILGKINKKYS